MGLFDTFIFAEPMPCNECGNPIVSVQSKSFGETMTEYRVGDALTDKGLRLAVVEERCFCDACSQEGGAQTPRCWITVWHGIYAGTYQSEEKAHNRLSSIDRLTILEWHERQQKEKEAWRRRFRNLFNEIESLREYLHTEDKEAFLNRPLALFNSRVREFVKSDDPLLELIKSNEISSSEFGDADMFE